MDCPYREHPLFKLTDMPIGSKCHSCVNVDCLHIDNEAITCKPLPMVDIIRKDDK